MSAGLNATPSTTKRGPLLDSVKAAITTNVLSGASKTATAQQFGVSRQTVHAVVNRLRIEAEEAAKSAGSVLDWRKRLSETLPGKAVDAIERSVGDTEDVHKAANTGVQVLKGLGHLAGEGNVTNVAVIVQAINALPPDIREHYLSNDDTTIVDVSDADTVSVPTTLKSDEA